MLFAHKTKDKEITFRMDTGNTDRAKIVIEFPRSKYYFQLIMQSFGSLLEKVAIPNDDINTNQSGTSSSES